MGSSIALEEWKRASRQHFLQVASHYDEGRAFEKALFWAEEIGKQVALGKGDWLLDLGCGTGLLAVPFASVLPCRVVGGDPSSAMLAQAQSRPHGNAACWLQAAAEGLPLGTGTLQAAFLSQVWHHLEDGTRAARDLYRVLKPGGVLFIKTYSHQQLRQRWDLAAVFPELMPFMLRIYPDIPDFYSVLQQIGFARVQHQSYRQAATMRPSELLNIAEKKLWSMFSYISEEGRQRGLAYLRQRMVETDDAPVPYDEVHLLVSARK